MRDTLIISLLFGVVVSPAMGASTSCKLTDWDSGMTVAAPVIYTINGYATPEFNPSVPVGTVLDSREIQLLGQDVNAKCSAGNGSPAGIFQTFTGQRNATPESLYSTYPTTVKGVGVRMRYAYGAVTPWWPLERDIPGGAYISSVTVSPMIVEFVKTGPITAQGSLQGEIGGTWLNQGFQAMSLRISGSIQIKPKVPTCSVGTKNIAVKMSPTGNTFTARDFGGVGGTTPERDFSIQLNCSGGDEGTSTNAYVTLTDNSNNGNRSNLLSLTPDSNATGVAIQILKDGKPLNFGPDSSSAGNPNQWKAGTIPQGQGGFTIPLTARYIQTGTLKGGTANAVATFTMSYQ
ncbi:fimbrial protein [Burkholderia cenocepacia]|uniref:fimbrial protein n=1 Tax=Burkholderia cenocepacia TaxID=95486 RepID=UPI002AB75DF1|nr:fimbrial protein [Burkholderia cenocepacia]